MVVPQEKLEPLVIDGWDSFNRAFAHCVKSIEVDGKDHVYVGVQPQQVVRFGDVLEEEFGYICCDDGVRGLIVRVAVWDGPAFARP